MKLTSVEDFVRIAVALSNPESKPNEYRVRTFGFCTFCKMVTEYREDILGLGGDVMFTCLQCNKDFGGWAGDTRPITAYRTEPDVPFSEINKIQTLHSKENQREFFRIALGKAFMKKMAELGDAERLVVQRGQELQKLSEIIRSVK